jgi:hypothetical protein
VFKLTGNRSYCEPEVPASLEINDLLCRVLFFQVPDLLLRLNG